MCAMERPHFFTGVVLSAPAILANPETATRFMVNQTLVNNVASKSTYNISVTSQN